MFYSIFQIYFFLLYFIVLYGAAPQAILPVIPVQTGFNYNLIEQSGSKVPSCR